MTWGAYSSTWSNPVSAQSTTASAELASATAAVTPVGYVEMLLTPATVTATAAANNGSNAPISRTATAGVASATGTANAATTLGASLAVAAGVASATATAFGASANSTAVGPAPSLSVRIDWTRSGSFGSNVAAYLFAGADVSWQRGRSSDFSGEATGSATFTLVNTGGQFSGASPSVGTLVPGLPVLISHTFGGTERAAFYGFIQRVSWDPEGYNVTVTCYDMLKAFDNTEASFSISPQTSYSARDYRIALLSEYERGDSNVAGDNNPSFEDSATAGWDYTSYPGTGSTLTRTADPCTGSAGTYSGEWYASSTNTRLRLFCRRGTRFERGTVYTASVWLKATSGTPSLTLILGQDAGISYYAGQVVTLSTSWQQYTVRYTIQQTTTASDATAYTCLQFALWAHTTAGFTVRVDELMVNRGPIVAPYAALGTGRLPNMCANGSFDGAGDGGWYNGFTNKVSNPSFETDLGGWSTAVNPWVVWGSTQERFPATAGDGGSWCNYVSNLHGEAGVSYAVTGTFKAGAAYQLRIYVKAYSGLAGYGPVRIGVGSTGTPSDSASYSALTGSGWTAYSLAPSAYWTPTADRSDVVIYVTANTGFQIDAVFCGEANGSLLASPQLSAVVLPYSTTGVASPGFSATAKYGALAQSWSSLPIAGSGRLYDFTHSGAYFVSGRLYTVSLWINPSSNMAYRVGIGASSDFGKTWADKTSTTGTATANTWTQVTLTWTPSADHSGYGGQAYALIYLAAVLFIEQTDTVARTVLVDGVRVIPGSAADEFELPQWSLGDEADKFLSTDYQFSDTNVGSGLASISATTLARHWITPALATPFYEYVTSDRDEQLALASSESFDDDDMYSLSGLDLDLDAIVNLVEFDSPADYVYDQASIDAYGQRPGTVSSGLLVEPADVGAAMLARKKDPHTRPTMVVRNRWPSQLLREVNEVVTVSSTRAGLSSVDYSIQSLQTSVSMGGKLWKTSYVLEEL